MINKEVVLCERVRTAIETYGGAAANRQTLILCAVTYGTTPPRYNMAVGIFYNGLI